MFYIWKKDYNFPVKLYKVDNFTIIVIIIIIIINIIIFSTFKFQGYEEKGGVTGKPLQLDKS